MIFFEPQSRDRTLFPHDPFKALVTPRPIGWISTLSAKGELNLAKDWAEKEIGKPYVDSLFKAIDATKK